jgi:hypothetical protein
MEGLEDLDDLNPKNIELPTVLKHMFPEQQSSTAGVRPSKKKKQNK